MYNILVVDDEARIRSIIKKYAEFDGHKVVEAADGMEVKFSSSMPTLENQF